MAFEDWDIFQASSDLGSQSSAYRPGSWYYEPAGYRGKTPYSQAFSTREEATDACIQERSTYLNPGG